MTDFDAIVARAAERKGGMAALRSLLPARPALESLKSRPDAYFLECMTRAVFQSGFVWRVIENKWPGFREAFLDFEPAALMRLDDGAWEAYLADTRIVRNRQKIHALRHNLWFVNDIAVQHGGFGEFLASWPIDDLVGLFRFLKKHGSRLGGNSGQYFLQNVGVDSFALTRDVVLALQLAGLGINDNPTSQRDLRAVQETFNAWRERSDYSCLQMSYILAYSVGENRVMPA